MSFPEDDLHSELMNAFREYFKAHHKWENRQTRQAGKETRWWLSEIRRIAKAERKVIMDWRYDIDAEKRIRKAQKEEQKAKKNDNQFVSWYYKKKIIKDLPEDCVGFVYLITNNITGRKYIGKKLAKFSKTTYKTVTLKNGTKKKKRIKTKIDSDWRDYYGSNDQLNKDVKQLGTDKFTREILFYCKSKAECSYIEAREQFSRRVLESNDYYNGHIQVRVHGSHILKS